MAKSLDQLNREIEKLQREAEALRKKEVDGVVARVKEAISHYGLTAEDFGLDASTSARNASSRSGNRADTGGRKSAAKKVVRKSTASQSARSVGKGTAKKAAGVIRFRDEAGNTWTGHGKRPNWFKTAIESGKRPEDLAA